MVGLGRLQAEGSDKSKHIARLSDEAAALRDALAAARREIDQEQERGRKLANERGAAFAARDAALAEVHCKQRRPGGPGALSDTTCVVQQLAQLKGRIEGALEAAAAARAREEAMRKRFMQLDVFKLDVIARELKKLEQELHRARNDVVAFDSKSFEYVGVCAPMSKTKSLTSSLAVVVVVLVVCAGMRYSSR